MRVVGMAYIGKNENGEIGKMWDEFIPRFHEVQGKSVRASLWGYAGMHRETVRFAMLRASRWRPTRRYLRA